MKLLKVLQFAYIFFFALFIYDAISNWSVDRNRSYMSLAFAALALFMFFFRKKYRKRFEEYGKNKE